MEINTKIEKSNLYISLMGELDQSVAENVRNKLNHIFLHEKYRNVIFDMSRLRFMDSTGIGIILSSYKHLKQNNIPVYIISPNQAIDKIIRISGLYTIIPRI